VYAVCACTTVTASSRPSVRAVVSKNASAAAGSAAPMVRVVHDQDRAAAEPPERVEKALEPGQDLGRVDAVAQRLGGDLLEVTEDLRGEDLPRGDLEPGAELGSPLRRAGERRVAGQRAPLVLGEPGLREIADLEHGVPRERGRIARLHADDADAQRHEALVQPRGDRRDQARLARADAPDHRDHALGLGDRAAELFLQVRRPHLRVGDMRRGEQVVARRGLEGELAVERGHRLPRHGCDTAS
jgi:hypothetical protein